MEYRANEINATYWSMKGDYRALDDSGFFLVSSMIIYVRGARHDQQSIPRTIPPLTFFFYDTPMYVTPNANEAETPPLPFGRYADFNRGH